MSALYSVKNLTADYLSKLLLSVIKILTEIGSHVISDNNRVNRKLRVSKHYVAEHYP